MLGDYVRIHKSIGEITSIRSTDVLDTIGCCWKEDRNGRIVSLKKRDKIWKEWWINASGIHNACPRLFALLAANGIPSDVLDAETLWNFGQGKLYHNLFQQDILKSFPADYILGQWSFGNSKTDFDNVVPDGVIVERGWGPRPLIENEYNLVYGEPKLRIPDYRVVVKLDCIIDWPDDGLEVVEIKTEKSEAKDLLNPLIGGRPRDYHVEQLHVGMWATGINRGRIIYVFKGERSLSTSIIEHVISRDEALIEELKYRTKSCVDVVREMDEIRINDKDKLKEKAKSIHRLDECRLKSKGKPKYCSARDLCFGVRKRKAK